MRARARARERETERRRQRETERRGLRERSLPLKTNSPWFESDMVSFACILGLFCLYIRSLLPLKTNSPWFESDILSKLKNKVKKGVHCHEKSKTCFIALKKTPRFGKKDLIYRQKRPNIQAKET